ncbi:MAG TPA: amylo-alpha-1,6-glucosidase [Bacteroidales bacterium]|nr:amylo-alpha-1,6-glucosidase [Bacteroidales bacterium]
MAYLKFDTNQLINLEYSLNREILRSNRAGSYACTSIIGCNTRKYHGLLICPVEKFNDERFVFLSSLDETVIQHDSEFNLGIHKFKDDSYYPKGHKYVQSFEADYVATTIFRVGGVILKRESLLADKEEQILIKYTLEDAHSPTTLRFRPFLAFRNIHELTHANMAANTRVTKVENGIKSKMYAGFPSLYMQFSKEVDFVQVPDWYYNIEYMQEYERGYDYKEDLYVPGYFETSIAKGESIIFSAALKEKDSRTFKDNFEGSLKNRNPRDNFYNCLVNAADQFFVRRNKKTEILAGYPWFGTWGRDTFISLPGLTLALGDVQSFTEVVDTMIARMKGGLFPNMGSEKSPAFNSVDAPLWFFWAIQQYIDYTNESLTTVWEKYGKSMRDILDSYRNGTTFNIKMQENGLIYAGAEGKSLTWMDAVVHGVPITPRKGMPVEINALWYNAIRFCLDLAKDAGDKKFIAQWKDMPQIIQTSFIETFWNEDKGYLADYVNEEQAEFSVRPNMVIATALNYEILTPEMNKSILDVVQSELLTPRGLRTLSPKNISYKGIYEGSQEERDSAYHQGTVWPWLLEHYARGYLKIHKQAGVSHIKKILDNFEEEMTNHGIGTISEIYNGDPPHHPKGAISQAWSVAALLQMFKMIENHNTKRP